MNCSVVKKIISGKEMAINADVYRNYFSNLVVMTRRVNGINGVVISVSPDWGEYFIPDISISDVIKMANNEDEALLNILFQHGLNERYLLNERHFTFYRSKQDVVKRKSLFQKALNILKIKK